jgi:hypothetical protein
MTPDLPNSSSNPEGNKGANNSGARYETPGFPAGSLGSIFEGDTLPPSSQLWQRIQTDITPRPRHYLLLWFLPLLLIPLSLSTTRVNVPSKANILAKNLPSPFNNSISKEGKSKSESNSTPTVVTSQAFQVGGTQGTSPSSSIPSHNADVPFQQLIIAKAASPKKAILTHKLPLVAEANSSNNPNILKRKDLQHTAISNSNSIESTINPISSEIPSRQLSASQPDNLPTIATISANANLASQLTDGDLPASKNTQNDTQSPTASSLKQDVDQQKPSSLTKGVTDQSATLPATTPLTIAQIDTNGPIALKVTRDSSATTSPQIAAKDPSKNPRRYQLEIGLNALIRQRSGTLEARPDRSQLTWNAAQPNPSPGVEGFIRTAYPLSSNPEKYPVFWFGATAALAISHDQISLSEAHLSSAPTITPFPEANSFLYALPYQTPMAHSYSWYTLAPTADLFVRLAPKASPLSFQVGSALGYAIPIAAKGSADTPEAAFQLSYTAQIRLTKGPLVYQAAYRYSPNSTLKLDKYFALRQQIVSFGIGYVLPAKQ